MSQGNHPDHPPIEGGYTGQTRDDHQGGWKADRDDPQNVYYRWGPGTYVERYAAMR